MVSQKTTTNNNEYYEIIRDSLGANPLLPFFTLSDGSHINNYNVTKIIDDLTKEGNTGAKVYTELRNIRKKEINSNSRTFHYSVILLKYMKKNGLNWEDVEKMGPYDVRYVIRTRTQRRVKWYGGNITTRVNEIKEITKQLIELLDETKSDLTIEQIEEYLSSLKYLKQKDF